MLFNYFEGQRHQPPQDTFCQNHLAMSITEGANGQSLNR
jgi:hypothetical protein